MTETWRLLMEERSPLAGTSFLIGANASVDGGGKDPVVRTPLAGPSGRYDQAPDVWRVAGLEGRVKRTAEFSPTHACPNCGTLLYDNAWRGYTGVIDGQPAQRAWACPRCGLDFKPAETRPMQRTEALLSQHLRRSQSLGTDV